jgi:hypothetical protein
MLFRVVPCDDNTHAFGACHEDFGTTRNNDRINKVVAAPVGLPKKLIANISPDDITSVIKFIITVGYYR